MHALADTRAFAPISICLALAAAAGLQAAWPAEHLIDDGGITVKYMDSFARGAFYSYNAEDGPVYGISGFLHGVLAGLLAWLHLCSPEAAVRASNFVGVALTLCAILWILRLVTRSPLLILGGWLAATLASTYWICNAWHGLETPLHLGVILLCYYFFLHERPRAMWLSCALAVVSKLDAVPIVTSLAALHAVRLAVRGDSTGHRLRSELATAAVWGGAPILAWLVFATWTFGSPLPQTAAAKLMLHRGAPDPFAFVAVWWRRDSARIVALLLVSLSVGAWSIGSRRPVPAIRSTALLVGSVGVVVLYSVFNPAEKMGWYYAVPEALLVIQAIIALLMAAEAGGLPAPTWRRRAAGAILVVWIALGLPLALHRAERQVQGVSLVEPERVRVGLWVHEQSRPGDRLMAGHGHVARHSFLYTYDASGLNSPLVTELIRAGKTPLEELRPEWVVQHGLLPAASQLALGYRLRASFYDVALAGWPAWRVWRRTEPDPEERWLVVAISPDAVETDGAVHRRPSGSLHVVGTRIAIHHRDRRTTPIALAAGCRLALRPRRIVVRAVDPDGAVAPVASVEVAGFEPTRFVRASTRPLRIPLPPDASTTRLEPVAEGAVEPVAEGAVEPVAAGPGGAEPLTILDPVLILRREGG